MIGTIFSGLHFQPNVLATAFPMLAFGVGFHGIRLGWEFFSLFFLRLLSLDFFVIEGLEPEFWLGSIHNGTFGLFFSIVDSI